MGNNPSAQSKSGASSQSSSQPHRTLSVHHANNHEQQQRQDQDRDQNESGPSPPRPAPVKREVKHPIPVSHNRTAAPPEPSLAQAHGTTITTNVEGHISNNSSTVSRGRSLSHRHNNNNNTSSTSTTPGSSVPSTSAQPVDAKPRPDARRDRDEQHEPAARLLAVQSPDTLSPLSPGAEAATMPHANVQDASSSSSYLTRPPRLPLPIDQELQAPGSPIISPADMGEPVEELDALDQESTDNDRITSRSSGLSSATLDEDDDVEELRVDKNRPTVPLKLDWLHGGTKVYVTGTIFQWNRKIRMAQIKDEQGNLEEGHFTVTCNVPPGTHHVRFLVDGQMTVSPDLPQTVDYGNNLVNYIEVTLDASAAAAGEAQQLQSAKPSPSVEPKDRRQRDRIVAPKAAFSPLVPQYLLDFDQPEHSEEYGRAVVAIEKLPNPPVLPSFLGKPILNAATSIKDDNSVLGMPNHTTLNHLATSSIKDSVLAVSATTRYKTKYVTTIIYKPTDVPIKDPNPNGP